MCRGSRGSPSPTGRCHGGTAPHTRTALPHTHPQPPNTSAQNGQRIHTAPSSWAKTFTPVFREAKLRGARPPSPQRCPVPLTWAGQRKAGSRRPTAGRAGGAAAPPSYGTGRDRAGRHRSPRVIPAPAYLLCKPLPGWRRAHRETSVQFVFFSWSFAIASWRGAGAKPDEGVVR